MNSGAGGFSVADDDEVGAAITGAGRVGAGVGRTGARVGRGVGTRVGREVGALL